MLKTFLAFPTDGRKSLCLDPCCGTGEALINICGEQFLYGIELNTQRGLEARNRQEFQQVLIGDFEASVVQNNAFGFLFLNPPYDYKSGGEKTARYEIIFLLKALNYLQTGGVLCYIIPESLFKNFGETVFRILFENFTNINVFRYPEPEYQEFKQYVVFGVKKKYERIILDEVPSIMGVPELDFLEQPLYHIPPAKYNIKIFRINHYDPELAAEESDLDSFLKQLTPKPQNENFIAPYYLDKALLALLAVGGYVDGRMPGHYLSGRYINDVEYTTELDENNKIINKQKKTSSTVFYLLTKKPDSKGNHIIKLE